MLKNFPVYNFGKKQETTPCLNSFYYLEKVNKLWQFSHQSDSLQVLDQKGWAYNWSLYVRLAFVATNTERILVTMEAKYLLPQEAPLNCIPMITADHRLLLYQQYSNSQNQYYTQLSHPPTQCQGGKASL